MFKPIHTQSDYKAALAEVSALIDIDPAKGSSDGDRLEVLATLVESYERGLVDMSLPAPSGVAMRLTPLPEIFSEFKREFDAALVAQRDLQKRDVGMNALAIIKQVYEFNEMTAKAGVTAHKRAMARLFENVQLQFEQAQGQARFKTRQSVRRSLKKPIKAAPVHFKHAA